MALCAPSKGNYKQHLVKIYPKVLFFKTIYYLRKERKKIIDDK